MISLEHKIVTDWRRAVQQRRVMEDRGTQLRPARPERGEGLLFAKYLDQAADGFYSIMLGQGAPDIIASVFPEQGHALSYEHVVVAERDGEIVAMSSAFTGAQQRGFSDDMLERAAGRRVYRMKAIRFVLAPMWRILKTVADQDFYLQAIGVDPDLQGAGIGSLLLDDLVERGAVLGCDRLSLDVAARNDGARRLYARRGFVEKSGWPRSRFLPTVLVRMTRTL